MINQVDGKMVTKVPKAKYAKIVKVGDHITNYLTKNGIKNINSSDRWVVEKFVSNVHIHMNSDNMFYVDGVHVDIPIDFTLRQNRVQGK